MRGRERSMSSGTGCGWCARIAGTWRQSTQARDDVMCKRVLSVSSLVSVMVLGVVSPALAAQGGGERVGENLGNLLGGWAKSLYLGIAGLVALVFLLNRRFADLAIFMIAATVVGGFVMAPADIANTVRSIWHTVAG